MSENGEAPPPVSRCKCRCLLKCINFIYVSVRFCCCICGCCCTLFWVLLIWALLSLSVSIGDTDWSTTSNTCYHKLNVTPESSQKEIQKAFRKLALKYHPDKVAKEEQQESQKIFQDISHCYEILNDANTRNKYDAAGYKEENDFGIPFDADINLQDIFQFFYENFDFDDSEGKNEKHQHQQYQKQNERPQRKKNKKKSKKKKNNNLKEYAINLKLEDIINKKPHTINIGNGNENKYIIEIKGGIPNGYIIKDELNGYNWKINVNEWDTLKLWKRRADGDCDLYQNVTITIYDVLMAIDMDILMIDGTSKILQNMEPKDYIKGLQIKNGGLTNFYSKRKYPAKGTAYIQFDILYPKLDKKQKQKLQTFLKSNGKKWSYTDEHNEL